MTRWLLALLLILMLLPGRGFAAPDVQGQQQHCVAEMQMQMPGDDSSKVGSPAGLASEVEGNSNNDLLDAPELIGPALAAPMLSLITLAPCRQGLSCIPAPAPEGLRRPPRA